MPDNSEFQPLRFFQPGEGESPIIRFLSGPPTVSLRGIGDFDVETVDLAADDRLDLNNLIAEHHGRVRRENPWMTLDGISDIWDFQYEVPEQPVFTREMLNQAWQQIRDEPHQPYVEARMFCEEHARAYFQGLRQRITDGDIEVELVTNDPEVAQFFEEALREQGWSLEDPEDPDAEFSPGQERQFTSAKERLDAWMRSSANLLDEFDEPEHGWQVDAHRFVAEPEETPPADWMDRWSDPDEPFLP